MMAVPTVSGSSRLARNMEDKRKRIFSAAAELFAERGFGGVSTQEVSDRADVAAGTLFRYAASKGELLLMVFNEQLRDALAQGQRRAEAESDAVGAILHLVEPLLDGASQARENSVAYQRELLFGASGEKYRDEGLGLVADLEERIASRLRTEALARGLAPGTDRPILAGTAIFAVTHLAVTRNSTGAHSGRDPKADLRDQISLITQGYLAELAHDADRPPEPTS